MHAGSLPAGMRRLSTLVKQCKLRRSFWRRFVGFAYFLIGEGTHASWGCVCFCRRS
jgi:hypothetical protein